MLLKVLAVAVVLFLVYIFFFKKSRENIVKRKDDKIEDELVECPSCKVYVSKKEALISNGKYFCSNKCLLGK